MVLGRNFAKRRQKEKTERGLASLEVIEAIMCKKSYYRYTFVCTHYYDICWEELPWGRDCEGECDVFTELITHYFTLREPCQRCKESNAWVLVTNESGRLEWMLRETARQLHSVSGIALEIDSLLESVRELEAFDEMEEAEGMEEHENTELEDLEQRGEDEWEDWRNDEEEALEEGRGDSPPPYSA